MAQEEQAELGLNVEPVEKPSIVKVPKARRAGKAPPVKIPLIPEESLPEPLKMLPAQDVTLKEPELGEEHGVIKGIDVDRDREEIVAHVADFVKRLSKMSEVQRERFYYEEVLSYARSLWGQIPAINSDSMLDFGYEPVINKQRTGRDLGIGSHHIKLQGDILIGQNVLRNGHNLQIQTDFVAGDYALAAGKSRGTAKLSNLVDNSTIIGWNSFEFDSDGEVTNSVVGRNKKFKFSQKRGTGLHLVNTTVISPDETVFYKDDWVQGSTK